MRRILEWWLGGLEGGELGVEGLEGGGLGGRSRPAPLEGFDVLGWVFGIRLASVVECWWWIQGVMGL